MAAYDHPGAFQAWGGELRDGQHERHCIRCGARMESRYLPGDGRPRQVCVACGHIFYENPKIVVGTIPEWNGRAVLVRRGIEPRKGTWTYPGGFMEIGESVEEGALRETKEETNLDARLRGTPRVYSRPEAGVVVIVYEAEVLGGSPTLCEEVAEIGQFGPEEIPWADLAFPTTEWALRDWVRRRDE